MTSDDDRIAYLAGEGQAALDDLDQAELDELKRLLADPSLWAEPSAGLEDAIVAAIDAEAPGVTAPSSVRAAAPAPVPPPPPARTAAERKAQRRWFRPAPVLGALAAAAAVVVALVLVTGDDEPGGDQLAVSLSGQDFAPAASGRAVLRQTPSGWEIKLDATGLPRLDDGRFYQAWLRNDDGMLVAVGTFNEGTDVVLWAGVSPRDFTTFTVTQESADGNQDSSGERVLAGPIVED